MLSDDQIVSDALNIEREKTQQLRIKIQYDAERRNYIVGALAMVLVAGLLTLLGWAVYGATQHDRVNRARMEQQCIAAHKNWHGDNGSCE